MFSVPHLIIIFLVALVVFGPEKLPELARNLGKLMAEFRRATGDLRSTFDEHMRELERESQLRDLQKREQDRAQQEAQRRAQESAASQPPAPQQPSLPGVAPEAPQQTELPLSSPIAVGSPPPDTVPHGRPNPDASSDGH
jgi:sec-independent protein translocase protein TatB